MVLPPPARGPGKNWILFSLRDKPTSHAWAGRTLRLLLAAVASARPTDSIRCVLLLIVSVRQDAAAEHRSHSGSFLQSNSSWLPPFRHGVLPASATDLGRGVSPLGHAWDACRSHLMNYGMRFVIKLMSIESVMPSNHLILLRPLLLPPSIFPSTLEAAQGAPRDPRRDSRGERSPW